MAEYITEISVAKAQPEPPLLEWSGTCDPKKTF